MPKVITVQGRRAKRGERMTKGLGWRLVRTNGRKSVFVGTLLATYNFGRKRIAIFSAPK